VSNTGSSRLGFVVLISKPCLLIISHNIQVDRYFAIQAVNNRPQLKGI